LTQENAVQGLPATTTYTYDGANRLTSVNGVTYSWDANGNLLNDGINTYAYDTANRLISFSEPAVSASFAYNGLNDRVQQIVNSQPTNYTLDLNVGLTQVLDDGTNTYLYGVDRIAQVQGANIDYFLGDALGSVRQLTNQTGTVSLARNYDPYGNMIANTGEDTTTYGFTSEQTDTSGLVYLRARYYAPSNGVFITRDPSTLDSNPYLYVHANPIIRTDPTGLLPFPLGGPQAFIECLAFHSLSLGTGAAQIGYGMGGLHQVTAREAVDICKIGYSQDMWSQNWFNLTDRPDSGHDLFGWYLYGQGNSASLLFDANSPLTQKVAISRLVHNKRIEYYKTDVDTPKGEAPEYKFNYGEQFQCALDFRTFNIAAASIPIACVLGSFNYQIRNLKNGWIGIRIDNRTDLESGTHIVGRFPDEGYSGSVEELLNSGQIYDNMPLSSVFLRYQIISILSSRKHGQVEQYRDLWGFTHHLGGGNLSQTYVWKEKFDPCMNPILPPIDLQISLWEGYNGLTITPPSTIP